MHYLVTKSTLVLPLGLMTSLSEFKTLISSGVGLIVIVSFLLGVGAFIWGIVKRSSDPEQAKNAFITSFLLAIAVPAVALMFALSGVGSAAVDPKFD